MASLHATQEAPAAYTEGAQDHMPPQLWLNGLHGMLPPPPPPQTPRWQVWLVVALTAFCAVAGLVLLQRIAPEEYRPSRFVGSLLGDMVAAERAEALASERALAAALAEEQARAQREVLAAQAEVERVKAEAASQLQQEVAGAQARAAILTKAYETLYQRSLLIAQAQTQSVQAALTARNQLGMDLQGGRTATANVLDIFSAVAAAAGNSEAAQRMQATRQALANAAQADYDATLRRELPRLDVTDWALAGIPDPASLSAQVADPSALQPQVKPAPAVDVPARARPPTPLYRTN